MKWGSTSTKKYLFALQIDYILGKNPLGRSYMVGFGNNPPTQAHHRGASVPLEEADKVTHCGMTFAMWKDKKGPNPNELTGAIVGGPDRNDNFMDLRSMSSFTEPVTYTNSLAIGSLAKLAGHFMWSTATGIRSMLWRLNGAMIKRLQCVPPWKD